MNPMPIFHGNVFFVRCCDVLHNVMICMIFCTCSYKKPVAMTTKESKHKSGIKFHIDN